MRAFIAIAFLVFGVAGIDGAGAADLGIGGRHHGHYVTHYSIIGEPATPLIIYDYDPGVVVRAYWLPPWRNRHYFPFGRDKIVKTHAVRRPKPAQTYWRYWSNDGAFIYGVPPAALRSFDTAPAPRRENHSKFVKPHENQKPVKPNENNDE
jgi:hypothetical protein